MGISKAIRVFECPLLCIWQFECSVHIFRSPWSIQRIWKYTLNFSKLQSSLNSIYIPCDKITWSWNVCNSMVFCQSCMASPMASSSIMAPGRAELCLETILNLSWSLAAWARFPILLDPRNLKNVFLVRIFSQINPSQISYYIWFSSDPLALVKKFMRFI